MIRINATMFIAIALLALVPLLPAQQAQFPPSPPVPPSPPKAADSAKPTAFYLLNFAIREMEGEKSLTASSYSLFVRAGQAAKMTAGSQVPYPASSSSMAYRSVGVSISCMLQEADGNPWLSADLDISGLAAPGKPGDTYPPVFRSTNISANALLTPGKATMIGSIDDPGTKHRLQIEVNATKLK
jgi:hypothetical protein